MKPLQTSGILAASLCLAAAIGCHSTPKSESGHPQSPPAAIPSGSAPTPAPNAPTAQAKPEPSAQPLIDEDSTAGVRGTQFVDFVVLSGGKPVQSANVTVMDAKGNVKGAGNTNDWGEFHAGLRYGSYKVKTTAQGQTTEQNVKIDEKTQEIELKLEAPPN
jgi:hypothetical protein